MCADSSSEPSSGLKKLQSWLGTDMRIVIADGRILIGKFACTDRDGNVILKQCLEYQKTDDNCECPEEPRPLGLAMIPGTFIQSAAILKQSVDSSPPSSEKEYFEDDHSDPHEPLTDVN